MSRCISTTSNQPLEGLARDRFFNFPSPTLSSKGLKERKSDKISEHSIISSHFLCFIQISFSYMIIICQPCKKPLLVPRCTMQHLFFILFFFYLQWILSYIEMKQPWVYMCSPSRSPLPPPSPPDPSRSSQCTRSEYLSHASNLGW